jgi:tetratricopeptide (TPR) repeat protein
LTSPTHRNPGPVAAPDATLRLALTALIGLQAIAGLLPGPSLWGLNHLAYVPLPLRLAWPALGLLLLWSRLGERFGAWLGGRAAAALLGRRAVAYGLLPLAGGIAFWLMRSRTHFLGDGWLIGELVARGVSYHGFDFLDYHAHALLYRALRLTTENGAFALFVWSSIAAGAIYLAIAAWAARRLATDGGERITLYALLVAFAPLEMFMGYVECYSLLAAALLLFLAALAAHYTRGARTAWVAAAYGAALAIHLDALFLAPLVLLLLIAPPGGRRELASRRALAVVLPIVACLAVSAAIFLAGGYDRVAFRIDFHEGRRGQRLLAPLLGEGSLLGGARLKDTLNLALLLAPVPLAMIATGLRGRRIARASLVFLAGGAGLLFLMLFLQMALGVARDWDLLAAQAAVFVFAAFLLWRERTGGRPAPREVGAIVATAICLALPWFWVNAGETRSVRRFEDVIADLPRFPRAYAHEEIGKYHRKAGRIDAALGEYRVCTEIFPGNPRFQVALGGLLYNAGRRDESLPVFERAFAADSTYPLALEMLARVHAERDEIPSALDYARRLARLPSETARAAGLHGTLALLAERYPEAEEAFRALLRRDPRSPEARAGLVAAIWLPLREAPESWSAPETRARLEEALRLADGLAGAGAQSAESAAAAAEIRRALGR